MNGITNEGLVLACSAIGAGLAVIAGIGRQVDAKLRQPLEYEQYKTLYSGGAVRVNNVWTSVAGEIDCCEVRYDRKTEKLKLRIVEPPREKKAQPKVAPRKPARGPKL